MKKILYLITQSDFGGAQAYVYNLATNINQEYDIVVAGGEQGYNGELYQKLNKKNIKYIYLKHLKRAINPWRDFLALLQIIKLIKSTKPDIIHLNSSKISILGSLAFAFIRGFAICGIRIHSRIRIIYTVHGWVFNEPERSGLFYKYAEKFTACLKDKIICISDYDQQIALKEKIAPAKKLTTIHNGIKQINFLSKEQARQKLQQISNIQYPIPNIVIGTIANLYKTKGLKYLIQAIKLLITEYKLSIATIIIGDGPEQKKLEKLIKQNNLTKNIILAGNIKNAASLLKAFNIYICSSVKEGLSYTIIEAMQAGLPIIATDVGGNPELIINNETGLLVNSKNPQPMAENIIKLINNSTLAKKLGEQAKNNSLNFGLEKMVKKTEAIYDQF